MIEIISTQDGSHTLRLAALNETYHSIHGAVQESKHVFIRHGFEAKVLQGNHDLHILEVGFGTGLNALLTVHASRQHHVKVYYHSLEAYPLDEAIWSQLNYPGETERNVFHQLHRVEWNHWNSITENFEFFKDTNKLEDALLQATTYDLVYFDAFAPEKQPEMWTIAVFQKIYDAMKPGATLVTYCAKGQVKRDLKSIGFTVEALPGPPGKREMIRAIRS
ncbi:MAG: tRNA (5-methylaminomethyl-2-thiouridine)(34)-methyltransferase MnmD [Cyclobacteriaceae bacterium]|nr:tRNA (5-methylaminomethyl-2-thiouridine)(34)-methyltransferase MnmD [Cyclobacteriaceae bacterium]